MNVIVTVTRNASGKAQHVVVNHRPRNSLLLFSRLMHQKFAGTPLAEYFLADENKQRALPWNVAGETSALG